MLHHVAHDWVLKGNVEGPTEIYSADAKRVLTLARMVAERFHHGALAPEHLLAGIMDLGHGSAFDALIISGLDAVSVRREILEEVGAGQAQTSLVFIPYAPSLYKVIVRAANYARNLAHVELGPEHFLLALLDEGDGVVPKVLKSLGVEAEKVCFVLQVKMQEPKKSKPGFFSRWLGKAGSPSAASSFVQLPPNFTPHSQQVMALARIEAIRLNHHFVGTEHVFLGLIKLGQGVAFNVLRKMGLELETVRMEIEKQVGTGPERKMIGHVPFTPRVKRVLALAIKEAANLNHTYVGTEHILLGLMLEGDGVAARVLKNLAVSVEGTRREILKELDPNVGGGAGRLPAATSEEKPSAEEVSALQAFVEKLEKSGTAAQSIPIVPAPTNEEPLFNFTPRAQQVLALSRKEAERLHHNFVGTEHLLLGLIALGQGVAVNVLQKLGLDLETVRMEVEKQVGTGPDQKMIGNIPYTPRVKKVLALASKEAKNLNHTYVGTEHILLGLLREGDGVAARVFKNLDVDIEQTRQEILKELDPAYAVKPDAPIGTASAKPEVSSQPSSKVVGDELSRQKTELTPLAQQALRLAREEAERMKHHFIGPEHVLIGLVAVGRGIAFDALQKAGVLLAEVREAVGKIPVAEPEPKPAGGMDYTRGKAVLLLAVGEAKAWKQNFVGTEHILLGLLRQEDGAFPQVWPSLKVEPAKMREEVLREMERIFGKP